MNWKAIDANVHECLGLLTEWSISKPVAHKSLTALSQNELNFLIQTEHQIREDLGLLKSQSAPSAFTWNFAPSTQGVKAQGVVRVRGDLELGLLIPIIAHECFHFTDPEYFKRSKKAYAEWARFQALRAKAIEKERPTSVDLRTLTDTLNRLTEFDRQTLLGAEQKAYEFQYQLVTYLSETYGDYREYLASWKNNGFNLGLKVSQDDLIRNYRLHPTVVR